MRQLTRKELVDRVTDLWSAGLIKYSKYLELKSIKSSKDLQLAIDEILDSYK